MWFERNGIPHRWRWVRHRARKMLARYLLLLLFLALSSRVSLALQACEYHKCTPNCVCDHRFDDKCAIDYGNYGWNVPGTVDNHVYHHVRPDNPIGSWEIRPTGMRGNRGRTKGVGRGIGAVLAIENEVLVGQIYFETHPVHVKNHETNMLVELWGGIDELGLGDCAKDGILLSRAWSKNFNSINPDEVEVQEAQAGEAIEEEAPQTETLSASSMRVPDETNAEPLSAKENSMKVPRRRKDNIFERNHPENDTKRNLETDVDTNDPTWSPTTAFPTSEDSESATETKCYCDEETGDISCFDPDDELVCFCQDGDDIICIDTEENRTETREDTPSPSPPPSSSDASLVLPSPTAEASVLRLPPHVASTRASSVRDDIIQKARNNRGNNNSSVEETNPPSDSGNNATEEPSSSDAPTAAASSSPRPTQEPTGSPTTDHLVQPPDLPPLPVQPPREPGSTLASQPPPATTEQAVQQAPPVANVQNPLPNGPPKGVEDLFSQEDEMREARNPDTPSSQGSNPEASNTGNPEASNTDTLDPSRTNTPEPTPPPTAKATSPPTFPAQFDWKIFPYPQYNEHFRDEHVECHPRASNAVLGAAEFTIPRPFDIQAVGGTGKIWYPGDGSKLQFCVRVLLNRPLDWRNASNQFLDGDTNLDHFLDTKFSLEGNRSLPNFGHSSQRDIRIYSNQAIDSKYAYVMSQTLDVVTFLCQDPTDNTTSAIVPGTLPEYGLGQGFTICVGPGEDYALDYKVIGFESVTCENEAQSRPIIVEGKADPLTTVNQRTMGFVDLLTGATVKQPGTVAMTSKITMGQLQLAEETMKCYGQARLKQRSTRRRRDLQEALQREERGAVMSPFEVTIHLLNLTESIDSGGCPIHPRGHWSWLLLGILLVTLLLN